VAKPLEELVNELQEYLPATLRNQDLRPGAPTGVGTLRGFHAKVNEVFQRGRMAGCEEEHPIVGANFTDGASEEEVYCGCGEPITFYDGEWMHIINPALRGTGDHDARPGGSA
jgi:hypothetical protein